MTKKKGGKKLSALAPSVEIIGRYKKKAWTRKYMNLKKETFIRPNGRSLPVDDFREWDDPVI